MRDHLVLYINGVRQEVRGRDAFLSLSDFLRVRRGLVSTKIVCSEGDCGACTVLVGRPASKDASDSASPSNGHKSEIRNQKSEIRYRPVDSCIQFMFQLDGTHIVTAEGLRPDGALNRVQQAMIDCHGSQCGFCTPGFVMAVTGLLEESERFDEPQLRTALTGNLCRCTGYTPILEAGLKAYDEEHERLNDLYPRAEMLADFARFADDPIEIQSESWGATQKVACPATLNDALAFLAANPTATIVAGATDVGVRANKARRLPPIILDLNRVTELDSLEVTPTDIISGARATWTALHDACVGDSPPSKGGARGGIYDRGADACDTTIDDSQDPLNQPLPAGERRLSEFARILALFGAPQIRHVGTLGGNIANASPIADSLPFLFVMDAVITLASAAGRREVNINNFYKGYKQLDLKPGELITQVRIPLPQPDDILRLYKVSRRRDLDIAGFTAAIRLRLSPPLPKGDPGYTPSEFNGDGKADIIARASIALGAVGPTVLRARRTEKFLLGKPLTEEVMQAAGDIVVDEITPITDVRGAADYRRQLARNVLLKFYHQTHTELATA
jgi:xanthine dehydrogenase small subunit